jgi:hypothetical protein
LEQFVYLGENGSVEVAERYFAAVEETCVLLVTQPQIGAVYNSGIEKLWRVTPCACERIWEILALLPAACGVTPSR